MKQEILQWFHMISSVWHQRNLYHTIYQTLKPTNHHLTTTGQTIWTTLDHKNEWLRGLNEISVTHEQVSLIIYLSSYIYIYIYIDNLYMMLK